MEHVDGLGYERVPFFPPRRPAFGGAFGAKRAEARLFVLNGVKTKRWLYYYNRYAAKYGYVTYGAEYGYGYGYGGSEKYRNPEG